LGIRVQVSVRVPTDLLERHPATADEVLEQFFSGRRPRHVEGLAATGESQVHVPSELVEDPPVLEDLGPVGRLDQLWLVLRIGFLVADRQAVGGDAFVAEGHRRGLEAELRADHVVRKARGRGHLRIDHHQQIE
jgi:hypothetical protein